MTTYAFDPQLVADPVTFQRAANASITVYDVADTTNSTPLTLTDLNGLPLVNPLTSTADAIIPPFVCASPQVKLVGGGLSVPVGSFDSVLTAAQAAQSFVQGISVGSTTTAPAGGSASVAIDTTGKFSFTIPTGTQGPQGLPGVNAVPADTAIAGYVSDGASSTRGALDGTYAKALVNGKGPVRKDGLVIDARDYGVLADGTTDDTAAWNSAITAASAVTTFGCTTILAPVGTSVVSGLDLPSLVGIKGHYRRSRLKLKNGSNRPVIRTAALTTQAVLVSGLTIDGNKANQTGGVSHGIHLNNQSTSITPAFEQYQSDCYHKVDDVFVINCDGDGVHTTGRGETNIIETKVMLCNGDAFRIDSFDTWVTDCTAGQASNYGFHITQPHVAISSCKAFMNTLDGLYITGVTGVTATNFVAQGNYRHGIQLSSTGCYVQGVSFDNNYGQSDPNACGVYLSNSATRNHVAVQCYTSETPARQNAALYITASCVRNIIDVTFDSTMPLYLSGSNLRNNTIRTGSLGGLVVDTYAATLAPDLSNGNVHQITLTGNITINAPTGTAIEGQKLTFIFTQDATGGRTVTWGSGFIQKNWQPTPAASATSVVEWAYWGGSWNLSGGSFDQQASVVTDTFAASWTPDTTTGYTRAVTLTGNITINRPTAALNGQILTIIFTQDATGGRTVTWGSGWVQKSWQPAQAANAITSVRWIYWGGNWNLIGGTYPQAAAPVVNQTTVSATYGTNEQTVLQSVQSSLTTVVAALKANGLLS